MGRRVQVASVRNERSASTLATGRVAAFRRPTDPAPNSLEGFEPETDPLLAFGSEDETQHAAKPSRVSTTPRRREPDERHAWTPTWTQVAVAALVLGQLGLLGVWMSRRAPEAGAAGAAAAGAASPTDGVGSASASGAGVAPGAATAGAPAAAAAPETVPAARPAAPVATVAPAARAALAAPVSRFASGWLSIKSPISAQIFENGFLRGSTDTRYLSLSAGRHNIELVNKALGYREYQTVEINAGQITSITLDMPRGILHINALPWAEVWIDGAHVGDTPLANLSLPIGTHDIVFRHPQYGAQRRVIVLGTTETLHIGVDLRKTP
jgi:hypothetical protein